jgi:hypothetical protein
MDFPILGQVRPKFNVNNTADKRDRYNKPDYGWRKSVHKGWMQCLPHVIGGANDWATEADMFVGQLGEHSSDIKIKICAVSTTGKITQEAFLQANREWDNALQLHSLEPDLYNIMFDPVPWKNGRRFKTTKFGFGTTTGKHPFDLFPEPVIFWTIAPNAYQYLLPWHETLSIEESKRRIRAQDHNCGQNSFEPKQDLMHLPGSLIHKPNMPPATAAVLYDAFSTTEVSDTNLLWSKY